MTRKPADEKTSKKHSQPDATPEATVGAGDYYWRVTRIRKTRTVDEDEKDVVQWSTTMESLLGDETATIKTKVKPPWTPGAPLLITIKSAYTQKSLAD